MHKTIFSRFLWVGGARVSTVGLGVILAVMLAFAAATTTARPAAAQDPPGWFEIFHAFELYSTCTTGLPGGGQVCEFPPNSTKGEIHDSTLSYTIPVETHWSVDAFTLAFWKAKNNCTSAAGPPEWKLERQVGNSPFEVFLKGTTELGAEGVQRLQANTIYRYRLTYTCQRADATPVTTTIYGKRFWIGVVENNHQPEPGVSLGYFGNWLTRTSVRYSGGSTREARQVGASALLRYEGAAVAWVTTVEDNDTAIARVVCEDELDPQGNFRTCAEVDTEDPDPGVSGRYTRVAWDFPRLWGLGVNADHKLRVISDESHDVDVDAFLVVHQV